MKNIKLIMYSDNGMLFEENFKNMHELKKYVKSCGGFKVIGDYEIYTQDNTHRYNIKCKYWEAL